MERVMDGRHGMIDYGQDEIGNAMNRSVARGRVKITGGLAGWMVGDWIRLACVHAYHTCHGLAGLLWEIWGIWR